MCVVVGSVEEFSGTLADLEARFGSEQACWDYLLKLRWPEGFVCPRCSGRTAWTTTRHLLVCAGYLDEFTFRFNPELPDPEATSSNASWNRRSRWSRHPTSGWSAAARPGGIRTIRYSSYWSQLNSPIAVCRYGAEIRAQGLRSCRNKSGDNVHR